MLKFLKLHHSVDLPCPWLPLGVILRKCNKVPKLQDIIFEQRFNKFKTTLIVVGTVKLRFPDKLTQQKSKEAKVVTLRHFRIHQVSTI